MHHQNNGNRRTSRTNGEDETVNCCFNFKIWTTAVAVIQIVLCLGWLLLLQIIPIQGLLYYPQDKGIDGDGTEDSTILAPLEKIQGVPIGKHMLSREVVQFPISTILLTTTAFRSSFDRITTVETATLHVFLISGILLGATLLLATLRKNPKLLLWWLVVDGLRTYAFIFAPIFKSPEIFKGIYYISESLLFILLVIICQLIFFSVVLFHRSDLIDLEIQKQSRTVFSLYSFDSHHDINQQLENRPHKKL